MNASRPSGNPFEERLWGKFSGILRWEQLDMLWEKVLANPKGWYLHEVGRDVPEQAVDSAALGKHLHGIGQVLREKHKHDYCGIVYADDPADPGMIKIYDPENLGVVCGPGNERILPRWILSRERPKPLDGENAADNGGNGWLLGNNAWLKRIFS